MVQGIGRFFGKLFRKWHEDPPPEHVVRAELDEPAIRRSLRQRCLISIFVAVIFGLFPWMPFVHMESYSDQLIFSGIMIALILGLVMIHGMDVFPRLVMRRWRPYELDNDGVRLEQSPGEPLRLRWNEIERVQFSRKGGITLVGGATCIKLRPMPFALDLKSWPHVYRKVQHHLAPHFDLKCHRPWEQYGWRGRVGRIAVLAVYLIGHAAFMLGALWYLMVYAASNPTWLAHLFVYVHRVLHISLSGLVHLYGIVAIFGPLPLIFPWMAWWHHRHNPAWRVRLVGQSTDRDR